MTSPPTSLPVEMIHARSRDPQVLRAVADLFEQVDAEMAPWSSLCRQCGQCCRFAAYGHRLFVTTMELSYLLAHAGLPETSEEREPQACAYLVDNTCAIHAHRLLGCRVFVCRGLDGDQQATLAERWHRALVDLHGTHCTPYFYVELPAALRQLAPGRDWDILSDP